MDDIRELLAIQGAPDFGLLLGVHRGSVAPATCPRHVSALDATAPSFRTPVWGRRGARERPLPLTRPATPMDSRGLALARARVTSNGSSGGGGAATRGSRSAVELVACRPVDDDLGAG